MRCCLDTLFAVTEPVAAMPPSGVLVAAVLAGCLLAPAALAAEAKEGQETAILAGGCFWGMEEIIREIPGVISTEVGYIGGSTDAPTYRQVCSGTTGHAEAVEIVFDPAVLPYDRLLDFFFRIAGRS